ncbi:MAG: DUF3857 domain-containing protein, partial [Elusimicrobia bacterium]|nr:DUF3857 domain-containing protein [Elusimicrobiota bacterium]
DYEVFSDSTSVSEITKAIKIFNDRGKRKFAEVHLSYDSTYESIEVLEAYTIKKDRTVVAVSGQHIRDVSKYLNFPLYSNARVKIISMPEVTPGSVIFYRVKYKANKLIAGRHIVLRYGIQGFEPYIRQKFKLILPGNFSPNVRIFRSGFLRKKVDLSHKFHLSGGKKIYEWSFPEIQEIIPEDRQPPWCEIVDGFRLSTFSSWNEIYEWWEKMLKDRFVATSEIKTQVKRLTSSAKSKMERARNIHNWVASQIRYVAVEYGEAGYRPHRAGEIFANKYGDCKDQAILLITMLKKAGIDAWPVLIGTKGVFELLDDFPELVFNHAIACTKINGELIFLDATAETTPFGDLPSGDQGRKVLVFFDDGYKILKTPVFESAWNRVEKEMKIKIRKDETISADRIVKTFGVYDQGQRYWLKYTKPVKIKEQLEKKVNSITPQAQLKKYKISDILDMTKPCILEMKFEGKDYLKKAGNFRLLPQWGGVGVSLVSKEERKYPIDSDFPSQEIIRYEVKFPKNWLVKFLPAEIKEENEWFSYERKFSVKDDTLFYEEKTVDRGKNVDVSQYSEYRKIILSLNQKTRNQVVFEIK